jgi:WD40 repeat protein
VGHIGPCPEEAVTCLVLDGNFLYSGSEDKTINVWDVAGAVSGRSLRPSMSESAAGGGGGGGRGLYSSTPQVNLSCF